MKILFLWFVCGIILGIGGGLLNISYPDYIIAAFGITCGIIIYGFIFVV